MKLNYKVAGVDLDAADSVVKKIGQLAKQTRRKGVLGEIGLFGGFFELEPGRYKRPVLVSSVDGVGTKIKIACAMDSYRGIGIDLVNHCVNDIMCCGAEPLYFLDYLALGKIEGKAVLELAEGLAEACKENGCALIGGETAEMPDIYHPGEFDIAGMIVGVVDYDAVIDGTKIEAGDILLGVPSNGLHTNGYTLARRVIELSSDAGYHKHDDALGGTIGDALLVPHRSYAAAISAVRDDAALHGLAHVTGGGIVGNTNRLLADALALEIDWDAWEQPPIFTFLQKHGGVEDEEMRRVFNLGIGLVVVVSPAGKDAVAKKLATLGEAPVEIGTVVAA